MKLRNRRRPRLRGLSINALIPNALTVLGLCLGLTAIRYAFVGRWEFAVGAIILAGIVDGLDGRAARILKASTEFGAQLDSLSDFLCFGVAPAIVLYLWALNDIGGAGWGVSLLFAVCIALRLARFNVSHDDPNRPSWADEYFVGVPAPTAGGMVLFPMMVSFEFGDAFLREPAYVAIHVIAVALLAVSTVPMYSGKGIKLRKKHFLPSLLFVGVAFAVIVSYPWYSFSLLGIGYAVSIFFSRRSHRRRVAQEPPAVPSTDEDGDDVAPT